MMYNKAVPPAYVPFEDQAVWEYVCTFCGDYYETVITEGDNSNTVNITKSYISLLGTRIYNPITGIEKKRVIVDTQTNVDNTGGTYVIGTTKEAIGITMKQMQAIIDNSITEKLSYALPGTLYHFEEFQYFTNINGGNPKRAASRKFEHIKLPNNTISLDFYTDWLYSVILDFPSTFTTIVSNFGIRIRDGVTIIFRSSTPPTIASGNLTETYQKKIAKMYVPTVSLADYQAVFNYITDRIEPIEGSDYEVFNAWEYDD